MLSYTKSRPGFLVLDNSIVINSYLAILDSNLSDYIGLNEAHVTSSNHQQMIKELILKATGGKNILLCLK